MGEAAGRFRRWFDRRGGGASDDAAADPGEATAGVRDAAASPATEDPARGRGPVAVDVAPLEELRRCWAVVKAVEVALGFVAEAEVDPARWHYDDGGGSWMELVPLPDGRAVLSGFDRYWTDTVFPTARPDGRPVTDLLADVPAWWRPAALGGEPGRAVGYVYGWDGTGWTRTRYEEDDGFRHLEAPVTGSGLLRAWLTDFLGDAADDLAGVAHAPSAESLDAVEAAGARLTAEELGAVLGPVPGDLEAGARAASRFAPEGTGSR